MILRTPIPIVFFLSSPTRQFHSHLVKIKYMIGGTHWEEHCLLRFFVLFALLAHPTCVFPSLVNDTHIVGPALYVVIALLQL